MAVSPHDEEKVKEPMADPNVARVLAYHQLSKHHLRRYAPSPGRLDWANQPDPFRTFAGAPRVELPLLADALGTLFADLYNRRGVHARRADVNTVAVLFELALGLSAWKEYGGARWALRCNPSSGNLHPTEGYAILPPLPGAEAGVYHYVSRDHAFERRRAFSADESARLASLLPAGSFLIGLSSIPWREAWKYGVRAFRYCQHDAGHALASVRYAAAALGWIARLLDHLGDEDVSALLGLGSEDYASIDPLDRERPDALVLVGPGVLPPGPPTLGTNANGAWLGRANSLSPSHVPWEAIDEVDEATHKPPTPEATAPSLTALPPLTVPRNASIPAATVIRQRRSCLALDGRTAIDSGTFYRVLDCLLPRPDVAPWDALPWSPRVHVAIFVHRVRGLEPGLYFFQRSPEIHDELRAACSPTFRWQRPAGCPEHLGFYLLGAGDYREQARVLSCYQEIAADGAFSLGMIAAFSTTLSAEGPWRYRHLFWEAGVLGQVLYLEAEAAGVRGTGIGCYFDDPCHRLLGLSGDAWQDLYHFTVGGPVEDPRLRTLRPYAHLSGR